ncbi:unnamed protein product [Ectocarpus sp. 12 AP-2014]
MSPGRFLGTDSPTLPDTPNRESKQTICPCQSSLVVHPTCSNQTAGPDCSIPLTLCTPFLSIHDMEAPEPRFNHATSVVRQCAVCSPDTQETKLELFRTVSAPVPYLLCC